MNNYRVMMAAEISAEEFSFPTHRTEFEIKVNAPNKEEALEKAQDIMDVLGLEKAMDLYINVGIDRMVAHSIRPLVALEA